MTPAEKVAQVLADYGIQDPAYRAHVAAEIVRALGEPTVEYGVRWESGDVEWCDDRGHAESLIARYPQWEGVLVTCTSILAGHWQEVES